MFPECGGYVPDPLDRRIPQEAEGYVEQVRLDPADVFSIQDFHELHSCLKEFFPNNQGYANECSVDFHKLVSVNVSNLTVMKKFAVVLSGCGVFDGAEIHEATLSLLAIARMGASYQIFAPDMEQHHVINHLTGEEMDETRNVLVESARIARGKVLDLKEFNPGEYDGLLFPGGFGAAKNLSTWAFDAADANVLPEVEDAITGMIQQHKPVGALCISPVILARVLGSVILTIGDDPGTAEAVESLGATHVNTTHGEIVVDEASKLVTTPCYMLDATIDQIADGADHVVEAMLELMD
jgi:enhancing lycopene biosynthesis protein 2